ncbi:RHS repeat-associated core domain-containing protein, partial [Xanthomonas translucens]|uniref:RHS repeat-associated core domain-containing protein n=2 Tax=Xanthomonas campestris pv. translucens TaxID=343 RepID=UPI0009BD3E7B
GQLVELRNRHRTATRRFDALGQVLEEVQDGFRVGYGYDAVGNRVLRETSAGNRIAFGYDLRDQVVEVAINDDAPIVIERDALGRTTREQLSAQVQRQFQYDGRSLLTAQTVLRDAAPLFETTYDYDRAGNLTHRRDSAQGVDEYRYDVLGRLLQHTDPKGRIERFFNDPAGDRLATRIHQVQLRKVAGGDDEQQVQWTREGSYAGVHYVFDRAGDLIRKGSPAGPEPDDLELLWDANHRLAESRKAGQATHYGYDPLGRRVFKRNPTHTTWFYWDGDALLGEVKQAHDEPDAAPVWVGNVADLIGVKRRKEKLAKLHERTREYVYYPGSFVPLALIEKEQGAAPLELAQPATTSISQISRSDAPAVAKHALTDSRGSDSTQAPKPSAPADMSPPQRTPSAPLGVLASSTSKPAPADGAAARPATMAAPTAIKTAKPPSSTGLGMLGGDLALGQGAGTKTPAIPESSADPATGLTKFDQASADGEQKPSNVVALGVRLGSDQPRFFKTPVAGISESAKAANSPSAPEEHNFSAERAATWRSASYHYHVDPNGRPTRLTAASGRSVWSATYQAWGKVADIQISELENSLALQGQYHDTEAYLDYNRYRYYESELGAYISHDPIRLVGGINTYSYGCNPFSWIDPWGLILQDVAAVLPSTSGVYHVAVDGEYYTGSGADILERLSRADHPAARLLNNPDVTVNTFPVDLGTAAGDKRMTNHVLRGFEQQVMKEKRNIPNVGGSINKVRAAAEGRVSEYAQDAARHNATMGISTTSDRSSRVAGTSAARANC